MCKFEPVYWRYRAALLVDDSNVNALIIANESESVLLQPFNERNVSMTLLHLSL